MVPKTSIKNAARSNNPASTKQHPDEKRHALQPRRNILQLVDRKWFPLLMLVLFVVYILFQVLASNRPLFWKLHDQTLFLTDFTYLKECLSAIGGLSVYVGSFLNEFFVYPWLGALIYTALLVIVVIITSKAFNLKGWLYPLAMIPSLLLLLSVTQNGYLIYMIKLDAYAYVAILGLLVSLSGAMLASIPGKPLVRTVIAVLYMVVAYYIAGVYGVMGTLLFVAISLKHVISEKKPALLIPSVIALLALVLVPRFFNQWIYQATYQYQLYLINLPQYWDIIEEHSLWLPYQLGAVCLLVLALLPQLEPSGKAVLKVLPLGLLLIAAIFVDTTSYDDENFRTELCMMEASEKGDWNQVLRCSKEIKDEPTRLIVMYTNMALFKLNRLGDEMYHYPDGDKPKAVSLNFPDTYIAGPFFFFHYGKMNYCYRWCMENTVEYGQSVTNLKYFVLCSAVNGQKKLARKYNNLLAKSLFYRPLAKKLTTIIENPSLLNNDPCYNHVLTLNDYSDYLDSDYSKMEQFLRINFANTIGGPPEMVELCLLANMALKNPNQFWPAYFAYIELYKKPLPIHVQEAALLYNHLQKTQYINTNLYSPIVLKRFEQFLSMVQQYGGMPDYKVSNFFKTSFGDTYWYFFSFGISPTTQKTSDFSPYSS